MCTSGDTAHLSSFEDDSAFSREEFDGMISATCSPEVQSVERMDYLFDMIHSTECLESWAGKLPSGITFGAPDTRTRNTAYDPATISMVERPYPIDEHIPIESSYVFRRARLPFRLR